MYELASNQWISLTLSNPPAARFGAVAVWTGNRLIVWGGEGDLGTLNTGGQLVFDGNGTPLEWRSITLSNSPTARSMHTAIWTGQRMIVWGGKSGASFLADGAAYDPATDSWESLPTLNAPSARSGHNAVWTGQEMLVIGGETASGAIASGAAYDPASRHWRALSSGGNPQARSGATAVWTGTDLLVFGGRASGQPVSSLQRLNPQPAWYFYRKL